MAKAHANVASRTRYDIIRPHPAEEPRLEL